MLRGLSSQLAETCGPVGPRSPSCLWRRASIEEASERCRPLSARRVDTAFVGPFDRVAPSRTLSRNFPNPIGPTSRPRDDAGCGGALGLRGHVERHQGRRQFRRSSAPVQVRQPDRVPRQLPGALATTDRSRARPHAGLRLAARRRQADSHLDRDQIDVDGAGAILTGGRVHGYAPFDPMRQVAYGLGLEARNPLDLVKSAVTSRGCIGVKMYPPMGFAAYGNASLGTTFWNGSAIAPALQRPDLGLRLDAALFELYSGAPPTASRSWPTPGFQWILQGLHGPDAPGLLGCPSGGDGRTLMVSFGHFGDTEVDAGRLTRGESLRGPHGATRRFRGELLRRRRLLHARPGQSAHRDGRIAQAVPRDGPEAGPSCPAAHVWQRLEMLLIEGGDTTAYLSNFEAIFATLDRDPSLGAEGAVSDAFFGLNAARYLQLRSADPNSPRGRLDRFYAAHRVLKAGLADQGRRPRRARCLSCRSTAHRMPVGACCAHQPEGELTTDGFGPPMSRSGRADRMTLRTKDLERFLPGALMAWASPETRQGARSTRERLHGTLLIADISGFTRLTAKLSRGDVKAGSERIRQIIDAFVAKLAAIIEAQGGAILSFEGDSLMAGWQHGPGTHEPAMAAWAELLVRAEPPEGCQRHGRSRRDAEPALGRRRRGRRSRSSRPGPRAVAGWC